MSTLFVDTETGGKWDFKAALDAPHQPRLVQLGAVLCDPQGEVVGQINLIVKPDGFKIPKEASDIHGITDEIAAEYGVKLQTALGLFNLFLQRAALLVAHNFDFDKRIIASEFIRIGMQPAADRVLAMNNVCTMKVSTDICKIPGPYGNKWPKLSEAYKFFFNEELEGGHDASIDTNACKRIYYHMVTAGLIK